MRFAVLPAASPQIPRINRRNVSRYPFGVPRLNWNHPLLRDVEIVLVGGVDPGKFNPTNASFASYTPGRYVAATQAGPAWVFNTANVLSYLQKDFTGGTGGWTVATVVTPTSTEAFSSYLMGTAEAPGSDTYDRQIQLLDNQWQSYIYDGAQKRANSGVTAAVGKTDYIVAACDGSTLYCEARGGPGGATAVDNAGFNGYFTAEFCLGNSTSNTVTSATGVSLVVRARRCWSKAERKSFLENPWQIFEQSTVQLYVEEETPVVRTSRKTGQQPSPITAAFGPAWGFVAGVGAFVGSPFPVANYVAGSPDTVSVDIGGKYPTVNQSVGAFGAEIDNRSKVTIVASVTRRRSRSLLSTRLLQFNESSGNGYGWNLFIDDWSPTTVNVKIGGAWSGGHVASFLMPMADEQKTDLAIELDMSGANVSMSVLCNGEVYTTTGTGQPDPARTLQSSNPRLFQNADGSLLTHLAVAIPGIDRGRSVNLSKNPWQLFRSRSVSVPLSETALASQYPTLSNAGFILITSTGGVPQVTLTV